MINRIAVLFLLVLAGCASDYEPSDAMLQYKKDMTVQSAISSLQAHLWSTPEQTSICSTRGFWYDEYATLTVLEDSIALFAHQKGKLLRTEGSRFGSQSYYEREYYRYQFAYKDIAKIVVYKRFGLLTSYRGCIKEDQSKKYFVIDLHVSEANNLKFIVYEEQFDEIMAVLTTLIAKKPIKVEG